MRQYLTMALLASSLSETQQFHQFYVALYAQHPTWGDLTMKNAFLAAFGQKNDRILTKWLGPDAAPGTPEFDLFVKEVARVPIWAKLTPSTTDIVLEARASFNFLMTSVPRYSAATSRLTCTSPAGPTCASATTAIWLP